MTISVKKSKTSKRPKAGRHQEDLKPVLLLELEVLLPEGVDTINHDLDELDLGVAKTVLVGDIISAAVETTGFSTSSTGLDSELLTPCLQDIESLLDVSVLLRQTEFLTTLSLD